jgi:hypothetical protein
MDKAPKQLVLWRLNDELPALMDRNRCVEQDIDVANTHDWHPTTLLVIAQVLDNEFVSNLTYPQEPALANDAAAE